MRTAAALRPERLEPRLTPVDALAVTAPLPAGGYVAANEQGGPGEVVGYSADGVEAVRGRPFGDFAGGVRVATADVDGDATPDVVTAAGPGGRPQVRVYSGRTGGLLRAFDAFEPTFAGGVNVAAADLTGDGRAEVVVAPDQGGGPRVRVLDGASLGGGEPRPLADFFAIDDPAFRGGARVAVGDLTGDRVPEVVVGAGFLGGPRVAGYDGRELAAGRPARAFADFFAFEAGLRNGVYLAVGDVTGDGAGDLVFGGGPGGGPRVRLADGRVVRGAGAFGALDGLPAAEAGSFFAGPMASRQGVRVAVLGGGGELVVAADAAANAAVGFARDGTRVRGLPVPAGAAGVSVAGPVYVGPPPVPIAPPPPPAPTPEEDAPAEEPADDPPATDAPVAGPAAGQFAVGELLDFRSSPGAERANLARAEGLDLRLEPNRTFELVLPGAPVAAVAGTYAVPAAGAAVFDEVRQTAGDDPTFVRVAGRVEPRGGRTVLTLDYRSAASRAAVFADDPADDPVESFRAVAVLARQG